MIAEMFIVPLRSVAEYKASMRPRSDDRGNGELGAWSAFQKQASMRPRSDDRENEELVEKATTQSVASMRPRSDDRGNISPSYCFWQKHPGFNEAAIR